MGAPRSPRTSARSCRASPPSARGPHATTTQNPAPRAATATPPGADPSPVSPARSTRASAAAGVASSLSLPIIDHDRVVGGINLYASSSDAFSGHHRDLADALGASAAGAVANADLSFETRRRAEEAPRQLRDLRLTEVATGILAAREGLDVETARHRLVDAAHRAGISEVQAAEVLIRIHQP